MTYRISDAHAFLKGSTPSGVMTFCVMLCSVLLAAVMLSHVSWGNTFSVLQSTSFSVLATAFLATGFSFCGLAAYDVIAVRHLGLSGITNLRAATAGAVGYGVSNFMGFPWVTGTIARHVLYRDTGAGTGPLTTVVMASWIAFWATTSALVGIVLLWRPDITARLGLTIPGKGLGIVLLAVVALLMCWLACGRHIRIRDVTLELLGWQVTLLQCGAAIADLAGSAAVLFVFLPSGVVGDAASFFGLFVVAVGFGVLSHVPAGLGAFEGTILLGLQETDRTGITSALVMYRLFSKVLPFLIASAVLGAFVHARRRSQGQR